MPPQPQRRPLATREHAWAKALARRFDRAGITPNSISIASVVVAVAAGLCLWGSGNANGVARVILLLGAAALIQLRLLCNMLDGMMAIESGRRTNCGEIFNDMSDRFADIAILLGAGYSITTLAWGPTLGWIAALLAVLTAYVRLLGGAIGARQYFTGPMAKPHRMAVMTVASLLATMEPLVHRQGVAITAALLVVIAGSLLTLARRTLAIAAELRIR
jgi:phosphatidylglycerophosphate synthase